MKIPHLKSTKNTNEANEEGEVLFERLIPLENTIDYNKLLHTSGNKENFNLYEFGSLVDIYQRLKSRRINFKKADLRPRDFDALIKMLMDKRVRKDYYRTRKKKKNLDNAELLYETKPNY